MILQAKCKRSDRPNATENLSAADIESFQHKPTTLLALVLPFPRKTAMPTLITRPDIPARHLVACNVLDDAKG